MAVLDGIRVVVTGSAAALDMSGVLLSDNGAEVIRIEPPGGDIRRGLPDADLFGQGGPDILTELGFAEAAIQALINGGVLVGPAASGRPQ